MKILFAAVFDDEGVSSNTSQARGFEKLGHKVIRYNYRIRASLIGHENRDLELIDICQQEQPSLIVFAKCNTVSLKVFHECKKIGKVCYWFPDPLQTYQAREFIAMTNTADFFCCDKKNVMDFAQDYNKNSFQVQDGFDSDLEYPHDCEKDIDISFIGSMHSDRDEKIKLLNRNVQVFSDAFGKRHSEIVSRSKVCLNFCTTEGASDRTYKTLAAGGFYLTDDWAGREDMFEDKVDLVMYESIDDLRDKIDYYLANAIAREKISNHGMKTVQKYSRDNWAKQITEIAKRYIKS